MSKIFVVSQSTPFAQKWLEGLQKGNSFYLSFGSEEERNTDDLESMSLKPWSEGRVLDATRERFVLDYVQLIDSLSLGNGHLARWWCSDVASKNRAYSPLLPLLDVFVRSVQAAKQAAEDGCDLILHDVPWPVSIQLENTLSFLDIHAEIAGGWGDRLVARLRYNMASWRNLLSSMKSTFHSIQLSRRYHSGLTKKADGSVYLIKSFAYPRSFTEKGQFSDPFFGRLAEWLKRELGPEFRVVTVVLGLGDKEVCQQKIAQTSGQELVPIEAFMNYSDVVRGGLRLALGHLANPFQVKGSLSFLGYDISSLVRNCFRFGGWRVNLFQFLHGVAARRIAKLYKPTVCVQTFEGTPWENMFTAGMRKGAQDTFIVGYQHAVVAQDHAAAFVGDNEIGLRPLPDRILTTGEEPLKILERFSAYSTSQMRSSCALRYGDLHGVKRGNDLKTQFTVLIPLGLWESLPLVSYVLREARKMPDVRFLFRPHPVLPFSRLTDKLELPEELDANVELSTASGTVEDLAVADIVLYRRTAVALEALKMGIPIIHFAGSELYGDDSLFELKDFKWVVSRSDELVPVLASIRSMPASEKRRLVKSAQSYLDRYLVPVSDETLDPFVDILEKGGSE